MFRLGTFEVGPRCEMDGLGQHKALIFGTKSACSSKARLSGEFLQFWSWKSSIMKTFLLLPFLSFRWCGILISDRRRMIRSMVGWRRGRQGSWAPLGTWTSRGRWQSGPRTQWWSKRLSKHQSKQWPRKIITGQVTLHVYSSCNIQPMITFYVSYQGYRDFYVDCIN